MIPSYFVSLVELPLLSNGKIDRKSLPPFQSGDLSPRIEKNYAPPGTNTEQTVVDIWQDVLNLEKVGIYDNFFALGGTSLDLLKVNMKLNAAFGREIRVTAMFEYTTIRSLAQYLEENEGYSSPESHRYEAKHINRDKLARIKNRIKKESAK